MTTEATESPDSTTEQPPTGHLKRLRQLQERLRQFSGISAVPTIAQLDAFTAEYTAISSDISRDIDSVPEVQLGPLHTALFDAFHLLAHCWDRVHIGNGREEAAQLDLGEQWDTLTAVKNRLEYLHERRAYSGDELRALHEQINSIAAGIATPQDECGGSGSLRAMLAHCRHLVREMQSSGASQAGDFIRGLVDRLRDILRNLADMKSDALESKSVDMSKLSKLQDSVNEVELSRVDGKFVPAGWSSQTDPVPSGQAEVSALVEEAHENIYDLLCVHDELTAKSDNDMPTRAEEVTQAAAERVTHALHDSASAVKSLAHRVGRAVSSSYGRIADMITMSLAHGAVDARLHGVQSELLALNRQLHSARNEWYFLRFDERGLRRKVADTVAKEHELQTRIADMRDRLLKIDSSRVDGRFIGDRGGDDFAPAGQGTLAELLERNFAMLREIEVND